MQESVEERHERILQIVQEREVVRVTELAAELGVSTATMRRDLAALDQLGQVRWLHGSVARQTASLNAHDTQPDRHSQSGRSQHQALGMVVPTLERHFRPIVRGAQTAASASGIRLIVAVSGYSFACEIIQIREMAQAGVKGLLLSPSWDVNGPAAAEAERILTPGIPTVLVERRLPADLHNEGIDHVCAAHAEGAGLAVRHLARLGHQRIALLSKNTHTRPFIRCGYLTATRALGIADDYLSAEERPSFGDSVTFERDVDQLLGLRESDGVRAAIVHTDQDAINLFQRLALRNIRVPEDFAIVSYGDEHACLPDVPLSAVATPGEAIGEAAMQLLLRRLGNPNTQRWGLELMPALQVRESCGSQHARHHTSPHDATAADCR
ncbi:LacI family DNA-binding transcriptional regulator [Streptomyces sp. NPDC007861]|uniref:LacI family DNA-binding transcriptional regulator n=1 Tax=Streptomyces sp. NPDC007861 TaxID=3154893 RepID=UPI0033F3B3EF